MYRKKSILLSHIFVFIGAALSCSCVAAKAPEMLMLGRVFVGINSGMTGAIFRPHDDLKNLKFNIS